MIEVKVTLEVDSTELQMLYEGVRRVRPFAEMSQDMADREMDSRTTGD